MPKMKKPADLEDKVAQRLAKTTRAAGLNASAFPYLDALTPKDTPQPEDGQEEAESSPNRDDA